jgi:integrase
MQGAQIVWSDGTCQLDGKFYKRVPVLVGADLKIVDVVTDWFRHLTTGNVGELSVHQYAYTLLNYWNFLVTKKCLWTKSSDRILKAWRNKDAAPKSAREHRTINAKLSVVYRFYIWAQSNGYVEGIIGELCLAQKSSPPPIIIISGRGAGSAAISSSLLYRVNGKQAKPVPTGAEMDDAFARLSSCKNPGVAERNVLMLRWASAAGLRRAEILSLSIKQLPSMRKILDSVRAGKTYDVAVVGKGTKRRVVPVDPELVADTIDYVETWRLEVIKSRQLTGIVDNVFISHTTGKILNPSYVSEILSKAFAHSNRNLTGHRARARYITKTISEFLDDEIKLNGNLNFLSVELILFRVADLVGHNDLSSLRYYLDQELKARQQRK